MRSAASAAFLAVCFALPAAAQGIFDDNVARGRIEDLRKQLDATAKSMDERLGRVEDRRALIELASQIEALRGEIARMRGQLEVLQNQVETTDKRGKDLYVDIDARLRKLEPVKEAVAAGLAALIAEHRQAIETFGEDTRDDTLTRAAEKIRKTQFKIAAYTEYLAEEKARLDRELLTARQELRAKVEHLATASVA